MANSKHLEILKQGVEAWNKWIHAHPEVRPDLSGANLYHANLRGASLREANLSDTDLRDTDFTAADLALADLNLANLNLADLSRASLSRADFSRANLSHSDLGHCDLSRAKLDGANLSHANLRHADLSGASLIKASLNNADLTTAVLTGVNFAGANLTGANFNSVAISETIFINVDLHDVKGLETVRHLGPSEISVSTSYLFGWQLPEVFLRGCGLSDWQVEATKLYQPNLPNEELIRILYKLFDLRAHQAIQINPLFISYNHEDSPFVDELEKYLSEKGIRFWRDIHDATAGRLEKQIARAIRLNPTVLLILSNQSVRSDWVEHEARLARQLEIETRRDVLCPIALDDSWKACHWPERLREQIMEYNILDFSCWNNKAHFRHMFGRLVDGLNIFYK